MKKILIFIIFLFPLNVYASPDIISRNAIIYDLTDDYIVYEKDINTKTSIASLTKILTTITAIENIPDLSALVTITSDMLKGIHWNASVAGLKVGDIVTFNDLLYASMLPSGADATQAIAVSLCGSINAFVTKMNELARNIGMNSSHFVNVTGLDAPNHYSTVNDVLKLLKYALANTTFKKVYTTKEYYLSTGTLLESTIKKYNKALNLDTSRIIGSKTGYTDNAGTCLSSLFNFQNHDMLIITIGAPYNRDTAYNLLDNLALIDYVDHNYVIKIDFPELTDFLNVAIPINNKVTINYKLVIFIGATIVLFYILVLPKKRKR